MLRATLIPVNCVQQFVLVYGVSLDGAVLGSALRFLRTAPSLQSTDHNEAFWERREEEEGHERSWGGRNSDGRL